MNTTDTARETYEVKLSIYFFLRSPFFLIDLLFLFLPRPLSLAWSFGVYSAGINSRLDMPNRRVRPSTPPPIAQPFCVRPGLRGRATRESWYRVVWRLCPVPPASRVNSVWLELNAFWISIACQEVGPDVAVTRESRKSDIRFLEPCIYYYIRYLTYTWHFLQTSTCCLQKYLFSWKLRKLLMILWGLPGLNFKIN